MIKDEEIALIRPLFDWILGYNDQTYKYHPSNEFSSGQYLYVLSLWTKRTANSYLLTFSCQCCCAMEQHHQHNRDFKHSEYHIQNFHLMDF